MARDGFVAGRDINHTVVNHYNGDSSGVLPVPTRPVRMLRHRAEPRVGRDEPFATVLSHLDPEQTTYRMVCICNGAGCGKSFLADHAARKAASMFPGDQLFLEMTLADAPLDAGDALRRLLENLGLTDGAIPAGVPERADLLRRTLRDGSLLVLDNVVSVDQVTDMLPYLAGCMVIITSRCTFAGVDGVVEVDLGRMPVEEACELIADQIGADRAAAEPEAVREIVELCDGLPLALYIAASQLKQPLERSEPIAAYAARLSEEHRRLDELTVGNHLDVRASFSLSYQALSRPARRLFRLLGWVQVPQFSRELVKAVDGTADAPKAFTELCNAYLAEGAGSGRARFHDLLAVFARERAEKEESVQERDAALDRVITWCADRAAVLGSQVVPVGRRVPGTTSDADALAALDADRDVLLTVIGRAALEGRGSQPLLITSRLAPFFEVRGLWTDWLQAAELSVGCADRTGDPHAMADARLQRSWPLRLMRRTREATQDAVAALDLLHDDPAGTLRGEVLSHLGTLYRESHDYDKAEDALNQAIEIFQAAGDRHSEGLALRTLGHAQARRRVDLVAARTTLERAIALLRETGDRVGEGWSRNNLCRVFADTWRHDEAVAENQSAMAIFDELGFPQGRASALNHMARIHLQYGRSAEAMTCADQALEIFSGLGDKYGRGWALLHLASARQDAGLARDARAEFAGMSDPEEDGQGWALVTLARLTADPDLAEEALGHFRVIGSLQGQGAALAVQGDIERAAGRSSAAGRLYDSALPPLDRANDHHQAALVWIGQASLARQTGDNALADELQRRAKAQLEALGAPENDTGKE